MSHSISLSNGRIKIGGHTLPVSGVISVASDGNMIAAVDDRGFASLFDMGGARRGSFGSLGATACTFEGGYFVLEYRNGTRRRYDPSTGADRGNA